MLQMLRMVREYIGDRLGEIKINDFDYFDRIWEPRKKNTTRKLGEVDSALATLRALENSLGPSSCDKTIDTKREHFLPSFHWCSRPDFHRSILQIAELVKGRKGEVGDPEDVHHICPPAHVIGYEISMSADGILTKELFAGRMIGLEVLRRRGSIIAAKELHYMRMESYGGVTCM